MSETAPSGENAPSSEKPAPVVLGYDGSDEASRAIGYVAGLLPGATAVVVTAWKPISEAILAVSLGPAPLISDPADADERQRRAAGNLARDGARRASQAGLEAESLAVRADGPIWEALDSVARERDARLVAVGSHGRAGMETVVPSGVSVGLVHHASRPVLVVTSPPPARPRRTERLRSAGRVPRGRVPRGRGR
jgi:nucleotide-binding universal stress UspA family protein